MKKIIFVAATLLVIALFYFNCAGPENKPTEKETAGPPTPAFKFDVYFDSAVAPYSLAKDADSIALISFAWSEFLALHWKSSYYTNNRRDYPDRSWNYNTPGKYPDLAVWETYAHRSELRPFSDQMQPFDKPPHYSIGTGNQPKPGTNASFGLWNNLDENNEIGSCYLYGRIDAFPNRSNLVLYQAKCNSREYIYVNTVGSTKARLKQITDSNVARIARYAAYCANPSGPGTCQTCQGYTFQLPCGENPRSEIFTGQVGAMEIKTAWRKLAPDEDSSTFITRNVIVYEQDPTTQKVYYNNAQYALIGMHIIHKTEHYNNFIFATWEHVDVEKHKMAYVEIDTSGNEGPLTPDYPRLHPIPDVVNASTAYVHGELKKRNPQNVLQYYRLVGVQGKPTSDSTTFSYFLANYVIESNPGLARFRGDNVHTPFNNQPNGLDNKKYVTMGGCQGCHGVNQIKQGGDFSFLMNNFGKPVDTPDIGSHRNKFLLLAQDIEKGGKLQEAIRLKNKQQLEQK